MNNGTPNALKFLMKIKHYRSHILITTLTFALPLFLLGQANVQNNEGSSSDQNNIQGEMQEVESKYREVSEKVQNIRQKAIDKDSVAEARDKFESKLEEGIVEENPDLEDAIEERNKFAEYIEMAQAGEELPEDMNINDVYTKYNAVHQEIMPAEQKVIKQDEVQSAYNEYQDKLVAVMKEIDSNVMDYLTRQNELRDEYQSLVQKMQSQQNN